MNVPTGSLTATATTPHSGATIVLDSRMQEPPALTVIVPVYNAQPYIRGTLDSILAAGREQVEIVAVNDGSTDASETLIHSWVAASHAHVLLLREPNGGASVARNTGIAHARGRYVAFCDSDDLFDGAVYRHMIKIGDAYRCDVIAAHAVCVRDTQPNLFAISPFPDNDRWQQITRGRHLTITTLAREPHLLGLEPSMCRKILLREFLESIQLQFPVGLIFEDLPPHVRVFAKAKSVALLSETGLYYRTGVPGQNTSTKSLRRFDMIEGVRLALMETKDCHICIAAGTALVGQVARMLYWCGQNVPTQDVAGYFSTAAAVMQRYPMAWRQAFVDSVSNNLRERIIASAFNANAISVLTMMALKRPRALPVLRFALTRHGRALRLLLRAHVRAKAREAFRRIGLAWRQ